MYSKKPIKKLEKIEKFLKSGITLGLEIDEAISLIENKFGVFVFCYYGRLNGQVHTLEIWSRTNKGKNKEREFKELLRIFEVSVENFRLTAI